MVEVPERLRRLLERVVPWFDRKAEERWKVGFERDLAASRAIRAHADRTMGRDQLMRDSFTRAGQRLTR